MWLILSDSTDPVAAWATLRLRERRHKVELVLAEELIFGAKWRFRLGSESRHSKLTVKDGRIIDSSTVHGVINRLTRLPQDYAGGMTDRDREYVHEEYYAFLTGWLFSFNCPVLNPPGEFSLSGDARDPSEWAWLAQRSGLRATWRSSMASQPALDSAVNVLVAGDRVLGKVAAAAEIACRRFAYLAGVPLLGIQLTRDGQFLTATPAPDLRMFGDESIRALEEWTQ